MNSLEGSNLPEGWKNYNFKEITNLITCGVAKRPQYVEIGVPFLSARNVKEYNISLDKYYCVSNKTYEALTKSNKPTKGDILYSRVGSFGEAALVDFDLDFAVYVSLTLIKVNPNILYNKFLVYLLNSPLVRIMAKNSTTGIGVQNLNVGAVRKFILPIPPLEEQKRIVAKIDTLFTKIDKAITLTEESLVQAKKLLPSVLNEVFEEGKADGWEEKKLEDVCNVVGGGTPKTKVSEYWNGEIVWLSPVDLPPIGEISIASSSRKKITNIGLEKSSAKLLPKGSVVYSTRASIGKIAIADIPLSTNQGFTNFICSEQINNRYLCFCLKHFNKSIENLSNSTTFKEVSKSAVKEFGIPVPSLASQMKLVKLADSVLLKSKQSQSKLEEQLACLKQLKSSILSKAFKGEL